jgi:Spy/CpxP family protein refolding chaperone
MSSASGVPTSSGATASSLLEKPFTNKLERTAPLRQRMTRRSGLGVQSMMKNCALLVTMFAMLAFCPLGRAQDQEPNIDSTIAMARANMRADRIALITTGMNFNDKEGAAFWPLYQQYEYERSRVDDRRAAVIKQYTQKYPNLTDAEAKAMAEQMFDCESRHAELKKKYYKKFNKVLPALTVAKFFQLERRVDLLMDMNVEYSLPPLTQAQYTVPASSAAEPPQQ